MIPVQPLLVFTADRCPHCEGLCSDLNRRGVRFVEVNLSRQPERMAELGQLCWEHRLPVVVDHERVSIGYRGGASTFEEVGLE